METKEKSKDEWPRNKHYQRILARILKTENQLQNRMPGGNTLAEKLSTGVKVHTTIQAQDIWTGGPGNFLKVEADPQGVGTIMMSLDPSIWRSEWLKARLAGMLRGAKERVEKAITELQRAQDNCDYCKAAAEYVEIRMENHEKTNAIQHPPD